MTLPASIVTVDVAVVVAGGRSAKHRRRSSFLHRTAMAELEAGRSVVCSATSAMIILVGDRKVGRIVSVSSISIIILVVAADVGIPSGI